MSQSSDFKVIIAGGSVSGLTLAHCLYHAGIDFLVLEKGSEIAFGGGASIGLQPNGLRILDQLGMYDSVLAVTKAIYEAVHRRSDGSVVSRSHFAFQIEERYGYGILFFERSELLQILYNHLPESCKKKVLTEHEVIDVETSALGATVTTKNGRKFKGDMVVGADGINSTVRRKVWDLIRVKTPAVVKKAESSVTSQYYCAFGVSIYDFKDPDLVAGTSQIIENKGSSNIVITSTKNRVFWFFVKKHDKKYTYPNIPRFTHEQAVAIMDRETPRYAATQITPMKRIWDKRTKFAMVSLEEVVFDDWSHGRIVLLGDAAHKVTPNAGHGGNTALESAAVLMNLIYDAKVGTRGSLDYDGLQNIFKEYRQIRKSRVDSVFEASSAATRIQALEGPIWKSIAGAIEYLGEDMEVNSSAEMVMGGQTLKFIEYKGKGGNVPWDGWIIDDTGDGSKASYASKIIRFLTITLAVTHWSARQMHILGISLVSPPALPYVSSSQMLTFLLNFNESNSITLPGSMVLSTSPTKVWPAFFTCMNLLPIGAIIAIEGSRSNNAKLLSNLLWLAGIAMQFGGLSPLAPLLIFAHCVESNFSSREPKGYILPLKYAKSLLLAALVSTAVPLLLVFKIPGQFFGNGDLLSEVVLTKLSQLFPLIPYILTQFWGQVRSSKQKVVLGHEDISRIVLTLLLSAFISTISHLVDGLTSTYSLFRGRSTGPIIDLLIGRKASEDKAYIFFIAASLIWCSLTALKVLPPQKRTLDLKLNLVLRMAVGSVLLGPGASLALLWVWREDKTRCMEAQWRYADEKENKVAKK